MTDTNEMSVEEAVKSVHKVRTSITVSPKTYQFAKEHAATEKMSVSQLIENLLEELRSKVEV